MQRALGREVAPWDSQLPWGRRDQSSLLHAGTAVSGFAHLFTSAPYLDSELAKSGDSLSSAAEGARALLT